MKNLEDAIISSTVKDIDTALVMISTRLSWAFQKETFSKGTKVLEPIARRLLSHRNSLTNLKLSIDDKIPLGLLPSYLRLSTTATDYQNFAETVLGSIIIPIINEVLND
jgi:hypothetical protein